MRRIALVVALLVLFAAPACGINDRANQIRGRGDAPVGKVDRTAKDVIEFPDRFSNVSHACDGHGHRVFVTTQTDSGRTLKVVDDKSCN